MYRVCIECKETPDTVQMETWIRNSQIQKQRNNFLTNFGTETMKTHVFEDSEEDGEGYFKQRAKQMAEND